MIRSLLLFLFLTLYASSSANACVMQGADIVHCAPKSISEFLFAPFDSGDCGDSKFFEEAKKEYEELALGEPEVTKKIKGKAFRGLKKDLETFEKMLPPGRLPQKAMKALVECDEIFCALDKIFDSREGSYRALSIARDSGYAVSLKQLTATDDYIWSVEDLRDISYATNILPERLMRQPSMDRFEILPPQYYFPEEGKDVAGLATSSYMGKGKISFKNFDREDRTWPARVIVHEMAHHFDYSQNGYGPQFFESSGFLDINGWKKTKKWTTVDNKPFQVNVWSPSEDACFPRDYAGKSPEEDLAEGISYYVNSPQELKSKCPRTYGFIKEKVFLGKEYLEHRPEGRTRELLQRAPELKKCMLADYQGLRLEEGQLTLEKVKYEDGVTNFESFSPIKVDVRDECVSKIKAQIQNDDGELSCTMRERSSDLEEEIKTAFQAEFKEEFREALKASFAPANFKEQFSQCMEKKDLRAGCLVGDMNKALVERGFAPPSITRYRGKLDPAILKGLGFDPKKALVNCLQGSSSRLKKYLSLEEHSTSCWWEVTKVFEKNNIQFDENDIIYSFEGAVFTEEVKGLMSSIQNDFVDKGEEELSASCSGDLKGCIKERLKTDHGLDEESATSLAQAIEGAL